MDNSYVGSWMCTFFYETCYSSWNALPPLRRFEASPCSAAADPRLAASVSSLESPISVSPSTESE